MIIDLDRDSLESLVKGSQPSYENFEHPLVKRAGHSYNDQYGKTSWNNLKNLTDTELYQLYLICKIK
jgi:hypothetical protein